jgi:hypothetical protein
MKERLNIGFKFSFFKIFYMWRSIYLKGPIFCTYDCTVYWEVWLSQDCSNLLLEEKVQSTVFISNNPAALRKSVNFYIERKYNNALN